MTTTAAPRMQQSGKGGPRVAVSANEQRGPACCVQELLQFRSARTIVEGFGSGVHQQQMGAPLERRSGSGRGGKGGGTTLLLRLLRQPLLMRGNLRLCLLRLPPPLQRRGRCRRRHLGLPVARNRFSPHTKLAARMRRVTLDPTRGGGVCDRGPPIATRWAPKSQRLQRWLRPLFAWSMVP